MQLWTTSITLLSAILLLSHLDIALADPQGTPTTIPPHSSPYDTTQATPTNEPNPSDSAFSIPFSTVNTITTSVPSSVSGQLSSASASVSSVQSSISSVIASQSSEIASSVASVTSGLGESQSTSAASSTATGTGNVGMMQKPVVPMAMGVLVGGVVAWIGAVM